ncbi:MAG: rhomboid family intramembrane serine protease [Cytophagales bacterium]
MQKITYIVKNILIINIILFLMNSFFKLDLINVFGLRFIFSDFFSPYQFFTHIFIHANFMHLAGNMFALFFFGPALENIMGSKKFLFFYIFVGVGASLLYLMINYYEIKKIKNIYYQYLYNPTPEKFSMYINNFSFELYNIYYDFLDSFFSAPENKILIKKSKSIAYNLYKTKIDIPIVGASGVIFGILTAFAILFPNIELFILFIPIPIKAKYLAVFYGVYELYLAIQSNPSDNIAHFAHLGGILFAYFFIKYYKIN